MVNAQRTSWMGVVLLIGLVVLCGCGPTQEEQTGPSDEQQATDAFNQGRKHYMRGDFDKAIERYTEAIRLNAKYTEAFYERGLCHNLLADEDQARADWNEAIRLDADCVPAIVGRAITYADYDREKRLSDLDEAIRLSPKFVIAYLIRGQHHLSVREDADSAIADFSEVIRRAPRYADAYWARAEAYRLKGEDDKANADDAKAEELEPPDIEDVLESFEPPELAMTPRERARTQLWALQTPLSLYHLVMGDYPTTAQGLEALIHPPADVPDPGKWEGPYLNKPVPLDPWDRPYQYEYSQGDEHPRIWSLGPDGLEGTADDILVDWDIRKDDQPRPPLPPPPFRPPRD